MIRTGLASNGLLILLAALAAGVPLSIAVSDQRATHDEEPSYAPGYPVRFALPVPAGSIAPQESEAVGNSAELEPETANAGNETMQGGMAALMEDASKSLPVAPSRAEEGDELLLLHVNFSLVDSSRSSGTEDGALLEVAKGVRIDGQDIGNAKIRISDSGTTLMVARDEMIGLLQAAGRKDMVDILAAGPAAGGFISFEEMRKRGMNVRYDAAADRVALSS